MSILTRNPIAIYWIPGEFTSGHWIPYVNNINIKKLQKLEIEV